MFQIPPVGKGSLYIRPLLMGSGAVLGLAPAPEYTFLIYVSPVGNYFKVFDPYLILMECIVLWNRWLLPLLKFTNFSPFLVHIIDDAWMNAWLLTISIWNSTFWHESNHDLLFDYSGFRLSGWQLLKDIFISLHPIGATE